MATLVQRFRAFMNSARGRRLLDQARRELAKPTNQQKLRRLLSRLNRRR
jgi:hypothetical protein